jgi:FAD/FMN-containing dehydrogenase
VTNLIRNYDGSLTTSPAQLVVPETVEDIQAVLRDASIYPSPVRAKGSYHSLTPCVSSDGTIVDMSRMTRIVDIDATNNLFTAQAGVHIIDAARALQKVDRQLMTNIEIGNMTLGSAACCHTKDALDGVEYGQVSSYVTRIKWVTPDGELAEVTEADNPELLRKVRSSYGLCGIVYEVTLRIKPIEVLHFTYTPRPVDELTQTEVDELLDTSEGLICWTLGRTCIFQRRQRVDEPGTVDNFAAAARRELWSYGVAHAGHLIDEFIKNPTLHEQAHELEFDAIDLLYRVLGVANGITLMAPNKIIDYSHTPPSGRYAFTFWAFPRAAWLDCLRSYLDFADDYFERTGFRCNLPLGAYHIRQDTGSLLSYTHDGEIFSIDPIHASSDDAQWHAFLREFNDFAAARHGIPLLNQSPFVTRQHVEAAYGERWQQFARWLQTVDPGRRMVNPFFADLLPVG